MRSHDLGKEGEAFAADFMRGQGYIIEEQNYRALTGELDMVARDGDMLCFIEIKTRMADDLDPFEAVDRRKQYKLIQTARTWLMDRRGTEEINARFDVLAVYASPDGTLRGELMKDAFQVS